MIRRLEGLKEIAMEKNNNKPKLRFPGFTDPWEQRKLSDKVDIIGTGKSKFTSNIQKTERKPYAVLGSTSVISYDDEYDYSGEFVLTARVGANAGDLYRYSGNVKISDNTVFLKGKNLDFIFFTLTKFNLKNLAFGTGQPLIKASELSNLNLMLPSQVEEQKQIGDFFNNLDNLITLHQRKLNHLQDKKKSLLQKMFPKNGEDFPELRFPGFTDYWKQRKVSEITLFHKQGFYTTEPYDQTKKYFLLRGTDLTENKLVLKDTPKINASEKEYMDFKAQVGDFLIVRSGTVGTYGIVNVDIPAIFGSYLIDFRFDKSVVTNEFFGYFYQSDLFKDQLRQIIQQSANTNINAENIKSTKINLPSIEEQKKIAGFLENLDHLITLHQRKLNHLKEQKKALLQQMFV